MFQGSFVEPHSRLLGKESKESLACRDRNDLPSENTGETNLSSFYKGYA